MKKLFILFIIIGLTTNANSKNLTIYTYDSFVSEWGPGPIIEKIYAEKFNVEINFVAVDSAATLLNKVLLEGASTKADIILGLDMNLLDEADKSNLFDHYNSTQQWAEDINTKLNLPIKWESKKFVPYNYGYFAFVYNNKKFINVPKSMKELINKTEARIVIQDPRTSTPGLGLLTWIKSIYGDNAKFEWIKLNKKIITVTKGWTDAYYNIFLAGEADLVLSYTTSPAAHIMFEENNDYSAINFKEGNYLTIEFAGILKSSKNKTQATHFLDFMLSDSFQSVIPSTNIMYPVTNINDLPEAYKNLEIPKPLLIDSLEIRKNKNAWIVEWLNAL